MAGHTLGDGFDDDDEPGELDLQKGSVVGGGAAASPYGGGGLDLDDDFDEPIAAGAIELDMPPSAARSLAPNAAVPDLGPLPSRPSGTQPAVRPSSIQPLQPSLPPRGSGSFGAVRPPPAVSSIPAAPPHVEIGPSSPSPMSISLSPSPELAALPTNRPNPAAIVAKYPAVPEKAWQAPLYACRVLWRQLELRQDLDSLRRRRSPDVALYEAALKAHDPKAFALGIVLACAGLAVVGFVFFLPVILRFLHAPD